MSAAKHIELVSPVFYDELFNIKRKYNRGYEESETNSVLAFKAYIHDCALLLKKIISKSVTKGALIYYNFYGYDFIADKFVSLKDFDECFYEKNHFDEFVSKCFDQGLQAIADGDMLSISRKIVDEKINFVMLSNDDRQLNRFKKYFPSSPAFNLNQYDADLSEGVAYLNTNYDTYDREAVLAFAKQLKVKAFESDKLHRNLRVQRFTFQHSKKYYIYYIRPRVFHREFIGSLYLVLRHPLEPHYINQLSSFISEVFSETAISRIRKVEKEQMANSINQELHHAWNSYFRALGSTVLNEIMYLAEKGDLEKLEQRRDYLLTNINSLISINSFFVGLMKAGDRLENLTALEAKSFASEYAFLRESEFSIKDTVANVVDNLERYFPRDNFYPLYQEAVVSLRKSLDTVKDVSISTIAIAFEIVVMDLIKNAVLHSESDSKGVQVRWQISPGLLVFEVSNEGQMRKDCIDFINGKVAKVEEIEFSAGIRTIRRIAGLSFLKWELHAANLIRNNRTKLKLTIPLHNA